MKGVHETDSDPVVAEVQAADAAYWKAYNSCDYAALDALTAEDVEFYHDQGGITRGRADLTTPGQRLEIVARDEL